MMACGFQESSSGGISRLRDPGLYIWNAAGDPEKIVLEKVGSAAIPAGAQWRCVPAVEQWRQPRYPQTAPIEGHPVPQKFYFGV